jgi:RNA polymerase sigma-70 factor (sigma-E family)
MQPGRPGAIGGARETRLTLRRSISPVTEPDDAATRAADAVGALYQATALGLTRLAYVILGDRHAAEDVVQEAFCNLYRRWDRLLHVDALESYVRAAVLNGCRSVLRRRAVRSRLVLYELPAPSAEAAVLGGEERDELIRAVDGLPARQRETLVLRYYLDLSDDEIASLMGVSPSTVRSAAHRALVTLARTLKDRY